MSKLVWDEAEDREYETGVKQGVLYVSNNSTEPGAEPYLSGVAWNGLTQVQETPSGAEANAQYADDMKYLNLYSAEDFGATIEAFTYPDQFAECDGSVESSGVIIGQQGRRPFGLCYRTSVGDAKSGIKGYKLHIIYNAMAAPSERAYQTINDSPEPITFSWEVTTTPVTLDTAKYPNYKPTALVTIDSTKADATQLAALEAILYGSSTADARLPLPTEILDMFTNPVIVPDINLNKANLTVKAGSTASLVATTSPAGETVTWSSSSESVATVEDGVVSGVGTGSATITASMTYDGDTYTDTCKVKVEAQG